MEKKKIKRIIYNILLIISLTVFVYSAYEVGSLLYKYHQQDTEIENMQEIAKVPKNPEKKEFAIDWTTLKQTNPDILGWILIPDTNISHAIVQGNDNSYYLNHTPERTYLYTGSIFMDYRATPDFSDRHTIVYGHNIIYGTMFAQIEKYRNSSFYESHPYVYIYTPEKSYRMEVVSFEHTTNESPSYQREYVDDADFKRYLDMIQKASQYPTKSSADVNDRIVTLSTCSYEKDGKASEYRYLLHLKVVEYQGKYIPETSK